MDWIDLTEILIMGVPGLVGVIAVILSYTRFRYSWIVFVCAVPTFYLAVFYFDVVGLEDIELHPQIIFIFSLLLATGVFALVRWYYKRPHKNTLVYSGVLVLLLCILFFLGNLYREGADRSKCILQMSTLEKLVVSHGGMYEINPGRPFDAADLVEKEYLPKAYTCPAGGTYTYTSRMPTGKPGSPAFAQCDHEGHIFIPYGLTENGSAEQVYRASFAKKLLECDRVILYLVKFDELENTDIKVEHEGYIRVVPLKSRTPIIGEKELETKDRRQVLELFSKQIAKPYHFGNGNCHYPMHAIRVYKESELVHEGTVCVQCGNFSFGYPDLPSEKAWLDTSPELEKAFTSLLPIPASEIERFRKKYPSFK